jgi:hypothetical protein
MPGGDDEPGQARELGESGARFDCSAAGQTDVAVDRSEKAMPEPAFEPRVKTLVRVQVVNGPDDLRAACTRPLHHSEPGYRAMERPSQLRLVQVTFGPVHVQHVEPASEKATAAVLLDLDAARRLHVGVQQPGVRIRATMAQRRMRDDAKTSRLALGPER